MYINCIIIEKKAKNNLSAASPRISRLYLLPKLHKLGIPGRPIVYLPVVHSGSPTKNRSGYVDRFLQPLTRTLKSYIRDTTDFLQKLRGLPVLPPESILVTLDVSSLYTNMPHDEGVNACKEFRIDQSPPTNDLSQLIQLILDSNAFIFNGAYFLQQQGTAMGTRMVPYANKLPLVWWRYIDDVFSIGHTESHA